MLHIKLDQIGTKVRGVILEENRRINFTDMPTAIQHCNEHNFIVANANTLSPFFQSLIKNRPNE